MKNKLISMSLIAGLVLSIFVVPAIEAEAFNGRVLNETTVTGNDPIGYIDLDFGDFPSGDGKVTIFTPRVRFSLMDRPLTDDDKIDKGKSGLRLEVSNLYEEDGKYKFEVGSFGAYLKFLNEPEEINLEPAELIFLDMTISVKVNFTGRARIEHYKGEELVETLYANVADGQVSFKNKKGFSSFVITSDPAPVVAPVTNPTTNYSPNDKNKDGVVSCEEVYGAGYTWNEDKKACVAGQGANSKYAVPATAVK